MQPYTLGIDIGGTKIALGALSNAFHLLARREFPYDPARTAEETFAHLAAQIRDCLSDAGAEAAAVTHVGVGLPGVLSPDRRSLKFAPNAALFNAFPLYDALHELMGADSYQRLAERGTVEVAPLAFMRGRTLSDAFIILDEAQNATSEQMKMFLTRLGANSRCIVTGDVSQTDLPRDKKSGLVEAVNVLRNVEGVAIVELTARDVVRHELVQRIVQAYEKYEKNGGKA